MITSLCSLFLSVGVLQQLASRSVQNELEAETRSGQLLSLLNPQVSVYPAVVSTQSHHRSLKKTKGMPSFGQSSRADFTAHHYNNDYNDCNVGGVFCERADVNKLL